MALGELVIGRVFAHDYRVIAPLGRGGMGSLYVVEQLSTSKRRALKLMQADLATQPGFRRRFELEAHIGARIPSDHVVEVIASGIEDDGRVPWLVMELLEGQDLAGRLRAGAIPKDETREILAQLCHALGEAHARDIVHRDIKPENIFLSVARRLDVPFTVKVLDFGIAAIVAETRQSASSARTQTLLGTPLYMAPEQSEAHGDIGAPADVWALGLIVFEMLTGSAFWRAAHASGSILAVATETLMDPIPNASIRAAEYGAADALPRGFDDWFARCVDRDPSHRYANATVAYAALEAVLGTRISVMAPRVSITPPHEPASMELRATVNATPATHIPVTRSSPAPAHRSPVAALIAILVGFVVAVVLITKWVGAPTQTGSRFPTEPGAAPAPEAAAKRPKQERAWKPSGIADCDEYMRESDCMMRDSDLRTRLTYFASFEETVRESVKAGGKELVVNACRENIKKLRPNAKAMGCVK